MSEAVSLLFRLERIRNVRKSPPSDSLANKAYGDMSGAGDAERGEMTFSKELLDSVCMAEAYIYPCFGLNSLHALAPAILPGSGSQDSLEPLLCG